MVFQNKSDLLLCKRDGLFWDDLSVFMLLPRWIRRKDFSIRASVAQSVVQLIRNQQVACSSHVTSSKKALEPCDSRAFYRLDKSFIGNKETSAALFCQFTEEK